MAFDPGSKPLIETLAAGIAHEVRNPLNAVEINLGIVDQELQQLLPDRTLHVYKVLASIAAEVRSLDEFVTQFLRFARPPRLNAERTNVRSLLSDLVSFIAPQAAKRGIQLTAQLTDGPAMATIDSFQLKQAILNLVLNALDATSSGGSVEICTGGSPTRLSIEIRDSGEGITADVGKRMFEVFFTTREGGTGLGLPISRQIAESHGGTIEIRPRPGGTVAILTLPVAGP